ncbi:hypothetical protein ABZ725_23320 [Streptomyces sp. NPDC006872]|uniref:hypothetical protein n=1 Tax=Streptomyces sp. NPDC006872 TaxID=3155720 RepID=UPI0033CDFBD4
MGVLARLFRRSKAAEEAATEEATATEAPSGTTPEGTPEEGAEVEQAAEAGHETAEAGDTTETESASVTETGTGTAAEPVAATDGVEIPRQQSAEEAADSEAGEGART